MILNILRKRSKPASDILDGLHDAHSHILPGVDDGVQTIGESLRILERYEKAGVKSVCLTPHVMEDIPNTPEHLREVFSQLKAAYSGGIALSLASENMLDGLLEERLESKDVIPFDGNRLLVETSYYNPPFNMDELLGKVRSAGFFPVLAHPERYTYMDMRDYGYLRSKGVMFQLNAASLAGYYGGEAAYKAGHLLDKGMYRYVGTDIHREQMIDFLEESRVGKKTFDALLKLDSSDIYL